MTTTERIREVCRYIETHSDESLSLAELSSKAGMSLYHFARRFKEVVGVTPKQYAADVRLKSFKGKLQAEHLIDAAVYEAGYGSPSRVYENAAQRLGMTPAQYRSAGLGVSLSYATIDTLAGLMMIGATERGICFVQFGDSKEALLQNLRSEYRNAEITPMDATYDRQFEGWVDAIRRHLAGTHPHLDLPLDIRASAFQMLVWKYLQSIPYGDVQSYGEIAAAIGHPAAARAVANACARNAAAVVIPCHRVIRGNGGLGGYRWGVERKRTLIDHERALNSSGARAE